MEFSFELWSVADLTMICNPHCDLLLARRSIGSHHISGKDLTSHDFLSLCHYTSLTIER